MYIKKFIEENGVPIELGIDNGKEFINSVIIEYLNSKNIKLIRGRPYQPHSQGAVERVHLTIKKGLICNFIENSNNFNLELELKKVVLNYNKTLHKVTKFCPIEIFFSSDNELYKKVYNNVLEFYSKSQKNNIVYKVGEKCFLMNNIITTNKKIDDYILLELNKIKKINLF